MSFFPKLVVYLNKIATRILVWCLYTGYDHFALLHKINRAKGSFLKNIFKKQKLTNTDQKRKQCCLNIYIEILNKG